MLDTTISKDDFLGQALALGIAIGMLSKHNGLSVKACQQLIVDLAAKRLSKISEVEKDAFIAHLKTVKNESH